MNISMIIMVVKDSFNAKSNYASKPMVFIYPYCGTTLTEQKQRKHFKVHKCNNSKCSYYQRNIKKLPKDLRSC